MRRGKLKLKLKKTAIKLGKACLQLRDANRIIKAQEKRLAMYERLVASEAKFVNNILKQRYPELYE